MPRMMLLPASKGKRTLVCAALVFLASQIALGVYLNRWRPELRDPAFGYRLRTLRERMAENPTAPLVLAIGSSRTLNGLSPAHLGDCLERKGAKPLVFNFGMTGSGSVRELMTFRRLRAAGIKPEWLLIETWPILWAESGFFDERRLIVTTELWWLDWTAIQRYLPGKRELFARTLKSNLAPLVYYRSHLLHAAASFLTPREQAHILQQEEVDWTSSEGLGWLPFRNLPANAEVKRREVARGLTIAAPLLNPLHIAPGSDGALREILDTCRRDGIKTALFLMPEHSACRRWYTPQARAMSSGYLRQLRAEYGLAILDARKWAPDEDFVDFCHLAPWGAAPFSERFGREALTPLLRGE